MGGPGERGGGLPGTGGTSYSAENRRNPGDVSEGGGTLWAARQRGGGPPRQARGQSIENVEFILFCIFTRPNFDYDRKAKHVLKSVISAVRKVKI